MSSHSPKPIGLWVGAGFGIILTFLPLWAAVFTKRQVDESEFYEEPLPAQTKADSTQFSMTSSFSYTQTWIPTPLPLWVDAVPFCSASKSANGAL